MKPSEAANLEIICTRMMVIHVSLCTPPRRMRENNLPVPGTIPGWFLVPGYGYRERSRS